MTKSRLSKSELEGLIKKWACDCGYDVQELEWTDGVSELPVVMQYRHLSEVPE